MNFYVEYSVAQAQFVDRAQAAERLVSEIIGRSGASALLIRGRAKDPWSLLAKMRRKGYGNPRRQVTDLIGVRVITYYADEVDPIVASITSAPDLTVSISKSVDKRAELRLSEFGYQSVHLVARVRSSSPNLGWFREVGPDWFEIQVRSILQHSWAEIEHEVVYKSGVDYPESFKRAFSALAGTLEILDRQFESLRDRSAQLAEEHAVSYRLGKDQLIKFDSARLMGFFLAERPAAVRGTGTWREAPGLLDLLRFASRDTPQTLNDVVRSKPFRRLASRYANAVRAAPAELSARVVCILAAALGNEGSIVQQFPEFFEDQLVISTIFQGGRRKLTEG